MSSVLGFLRNIRHFLQLEAYKGIFYLARSLENGFMSINMNTKSKHSKQGFILLELLIVMSMVLSSWVALTHAYQGLALRFGQNQEKRMQIRKKLDQFEIYYHRTASARGGHHK